MSATQRAPSGPVLSVVGLNQLSDDARNSDRCSSAARRAVKVHLFGSMTMRCTTLCTTSLMKMLQRRGRESISSGGEGAERESACLPLEIDSRPRSTDSEKPGPNSSSRYTQCPQADVTTPGAPSGERSSGSRKLVPREASEPSLGIRITHAAPFGANAASRSSASLTPSERGGDAVPAGETVRAWADWLRAHPGASFMIEGHCDERGTREYNLGLGARRATSIKNLLVSLGVEASRVRTISYGKERPAEGGGDEGAWAKNRRGVAVPSGSGA